QSLGGRIVLSAGVRAIMRRDNAWVIATSAGDFQAGYLVACAGLHADVICRMAGEAPAVRIVPFRGEYYRLVPERAALVRGLIYPLPDPTFPFLGVHLTRRIGGAVDAGPNALLALAREGHTPTTIRPLE